MDDAFRYAQGIIKCLSGVDFQVIENSEQALPKAIIKSLEGLFLELPATPEWFSTYRLLQNNCIYEFRTVIGLKYLAFLDTMGTQLFLLGPTLMESYSEANVRQNLRKLPLSANTRGRILSQCARVPAVPIGILHSLCKLLSEQFAGNQGKVIFRAVDLTSGFKDPSNATLQTEISMMRQVESRYELSAILTEAVKQGNLSMALELLRGYNPGVDTEIRNADPLRNLQYYCIVLNTQLRHALEESGIHPYRLDRLSHEIGLEIENMRSTDNAQNFIFLVLQRYCRLVQESAYPNLKPLIHLAVTYIKEHLNEDLTVKETARKLGVNANYLSTQFHNSMGLSFIDFIHRERANQAAALLKHTNLQIQQVASSVGYNNTSYFARQFARFQKMSPSQYRREGTI